VMTCSGYLAHPFEYAVWTDSHNATPCAAVDAFRAGTAGKPDVITKCPTTFGNTDIFLGIVS
jgi:hypothetical protein